MPWRPLVTDPARRAALRAVIAEVSAAVAAHPPRTATDLADRALLLAYAAADGAVPDPDGEADRALGAAVEGAATVAGAAGLFGGLAHVGWAIAHATDEATADAACAAIDARLAALAPALPSYDLIGGLVGLGVYALERGEPGRALAEAVLAELERRARPRAGGLAWFTPPAQLPPWQRQHAPGGYWNYGLAHGAAGVVALLARLVAAEVAPARSRALLEAAVAHLLGAAPAPPPASAHGRYAAWDPRTGPASPRLAWCYGDLGAAAALLGAGLLAGEAAWRDEGLALARACAARSEAAAAVRDAALCHGALGVAHLLNRMAQATGDAALGAAAAAWIDRGLALRRAEPIGGFPQLQERDGVVGHAPDPSLLAGAAGAALALAAACSDVEPLWDRLLLVDLPPA